jgi:predicted enzyme related to lactoylglutathione lyase
MADNTVRGRFVWHELMTPDTSGAHAFYSKVLGWKTQAFENDPSYQMFAAGSGPLGGSVAQASGTPHWLHYVGTPDIEATVQAAKSRGGSVTKEVTSIPGGAGKYAVLADPQGAAIAVYQSSADAGKESPAKRGEFSWHELATSDWRAAIDFYSAVFGWEKMAEHDMGPEMGKYVLFGSNGVQRGGMFNKPAEMPGGPGWLGYVRVKDVNDAVKRAKGARGTLINGPMEVPGGDWIVQGIDPQGAMFSLVSRKS